MDFGKGLAFGIIALFSIAIASHIFYGVQFNSNSPTGYVVADEIQPFCLETDDNRAYKAGATTAFGNTVADVCLDDNTLKEFYCVGDLRTSREVTCPFGCENGECK